MNAAVLFFIFSFLSSLVLVSFAQTTPHLDQVFVGKCYEKNPTGVNCTQLWDTFSVAASSNNLQVTGAAYDAFFSISDFTTPKNGILFWSGNQAFALSISNNPGGQYTTVEGTSSGYVLNGLSWCGTVNNTFDYVNTCLYPSTPTYYGMQGVWDTCSHYFATGASGKITVLLEPALLNYNSGPYLAYRNTSVFSRIELPSMIASQITDVTILLIANKTLAPSEVCGSGSLVSLVDTMTTKFGFQPTCIDDPKAIFELLCPDGITNTPECLTASMAFNDISPSPSPSPSPTPTPCPFQPTPVKQRIYLIWALFVSAALAASLIIVIYLALRVSKLQSNEYRTIH